MDFKPSRAELAALIKQAGPACLEPQAWADALLPAMERYGINDKDVAAMFMSQLFVESNELNRVAENLNYKADRLMAVWPRRFPTALIANQYARNPEALANYVYGGRLGNTAPGDGWKYRGRGPIQTTGKTNYAALERALGVPLLAKPDLLLEKPVGALAAGFYWESRRLSPVADDVVGDNQDRDFVTVTQAINGGHHGLEMRQRYWTAWKAALGIV